MILWKNFRTMSDVVERILYESRTTSYRVKIDQFRNKMNQWKPGRSLELKPFVAHDDKTQFHLEVFPNGSKDEHKGHVSIFLHNDNDKSVHCSYELRIGSQTRSDEDMHFPPNEAWGSGKIFDHFFCRSWKKETVDERLEIFCKISKLWTETDDMVFKSSQKLANEKQEMKMSSLEANVFLQEMGSSKVNQRSLPVPECPACCEPLTMTPRIAQCVMGHLLCWNCKQRPEMADCPSCRMPICGRAFGMENYLKTLFPTPGEFQFLADKDGLAAAVNVEERRIGA